MVATTAGNAYYTPFPEINQGSCGVTFEVLWNIRVRISSLATRLCLLLAIRCNDSRPLRYRDEIYSESHTPIANRTIESNVTVAISPRVAVEAFEAPRAGIGISEGIAIGAGAVVVGRIVIIPCFRWRETSQ